MSYLKTRWLELALHHLLMYPEGIHVDWVVVVCTPHWANFIGGARTVLDGTPPRGSCGSSFCSDLFAIPWHDDNVVITPWGFGRSNEQSS